MSSPTTSAPPPTPASLGSDCRQGGGRVRLLQGVLPIRRGEVIAELIAGVTLAALAIPEVLGYTKISGTPVVTGLYTLLLPVLLFALFGASRHLVVGADSATAAIMASGLSGLAITGSPKYVALAGALALMAAAFLALARLARLGFMANFLSRTVLIGFLTGIGLEVAISQIPGALGMSPPGHSSAARLVHSLSNMTQANPYAAAVTLGVLATIFASRWLSRYLPMRLPGALIAVIAAIVAVSTLGLDAHLRVVGSVSGGLPPLGLPDLHWSASLIGQLAPTAFAIFIVILAQSAATARAYAARYGEHLDEDTDLTGLALANLGAGLSGAFVINGSPTKTQMVDSAGGRSQLSTLVAAAVVLSVLLWFTGPLASLPEAALAAVVFVIGLDLIDLRGMVRVYRERPAEFWVALITTLTVVLVGVEQGIVLAIVLSLVVHTRHGYHPHNRLLVPSPSGAWRAASVHTHAQAAPGLTIYQFRHSMYYANSEQLAQELRCLAEHPRSETPRWICLDATAVDDVDFTAAQTLRRLCVDFERRGIRVVVSQIMDDLDARPRAQLEQIVGADACFNTLAEVVAAYSSLSTERAEGGSPPEDAESE